MKASAGLLFKRTIASALCASVLLGGFPDIAAAETDESQKKDVSNDTGRPAEGGSTYFKTDLIDFDRDAINKQTIKLAYEQYRNLHNDDVSALDNWNWNWDTVHDCRKNVPALLFVDWSTSGSGQNDVCYPENDRYQIRSYFYDVNQNIDNWDRENKDGENAYNSLDASRRQWKTESEGVAYQGIVSRQLGENHKPQFNLSVYDPFNTELKEDGRTVYAGIDTEFKYSDGYYVLDSDRHDYKYDDSCRKIRIADDNTHGFFPLSAKEQKDNVNFGMQFETDFTMSEDGKYDGQDCVFEFSGDDDVWVFVDDKLALDLGGIHEKCSGKIDFANQNVTYNCGVFVAEKPGEDGTYYGPGRTVSFQDLGLDGVLDNGKHTLRFFYLERGGGESNCKIKFNLPTINTNKDIKGDYTLSKKTPQGESVYGAGFTLYDAKDQIVGGEQFTDGNGKVTFHDLTTGVYTLKETTVPDGYSGDGKTYTLLVSGNASDKLLFSLMERGADGKLSLVRNNTVFNSKTSELGVTLSKEAKLVNWQDRTYDINLAAEAKLSKKSVTENPVDIVLVLDASGSMYFPTSLQPYQRAEGEKLDRNRSYYFVSENAQATVYKVVWNGTSWVYYDSSNEYTGGSKNQGTVKENKSWVQSAYGQWSERYTYSCGVQSDMQFYTSDNPSPRINQLKESAKNFVLNMAKISENNRIGLVYFNKEAGQLLDGELLGLTSDNVDKMLAEIDNLDGKISGGTRQDLGMKYALEMVNAALEEERAAQETATAMVAETVIVTTKTDSDSSDENLKETTEKQDINNDATEEAAQTAALSESTEIESTEIENTETESGNESCLLNAGIQVTRTSELLGANTTEENEVSEGANISETTDASNSESSCDVVQYDTENSDTGDTETPSIGSDGRASDTEVPVDSAHQETEPESVEDVEKEEPVVDETKDGEESELPVRNRYVVLLTDGCPNGGNVEADLNGENGYATQLKAMDGVKVITVGIDINDYMGSANQLLSHAASTDEDGNLLYYKGSSSNMDDLFQRIGKLIIHENWDFEYFGGEVRDYINSKFNIISAGGGTIGHDENGTYVSWNVGALEDWTATIRVQAVDEYLGGNAINTNGPQSGVKVRGKWYYFEQPKVNVRLIVRAGSTGDTIFLGQSLGRYFTQNQIDRIFAEQKKDTEDVTLSYKCTDKSGNHIYASDGEIPKTFSNLGKYIGGLSPESDTTYYFKVIATPNIADQSEAAASAAKSMSSDGNDYTASMQDAKTPAQSASATGTYEVKVMDGTLTIQKKYNHDFLSHLPYSAKEKELIEAEQSTVFRVERYAEETTKESISDGTAQLLESFQVTVNGNDSQKIVGLKAGVYRIVEDTKWTWKYNLNTINETWASVETGQTNNNFSLDGETAQAFQDEDGIFYLGKFRAGVVHAGETEKDGDREETFSDMKTIFKNKIDTDMEHFPSWFADTTHIRNEFCSGGETIDTHLQNRLTYRQGTDETADTRDYIMDSSEIGGTGTDK